MTQRPNLKSRATRAERTCLDPSLIIWNWPALCASRIARGRVAIDTVGRRSVRAHDSGHREAQTGVAAGYAQQAFLTGVLHCVTKPAVTDPDPGPYLRQCQDHHWGLQAPAYESNKPSCFSTRSASQHSLDLFPEK